MSSFDALESQQEIDKIAPSSATENSSEVEQQQDKDNVDDPDLLTCRNCHKQYKASENVDDCCLWYSDTHKGEFQVNWKSDFWYDWNEGRGPPDSAYCRREYGREGGYVWSICGCDHNRDECEREGKHKPEGEPLSDDDFEIPYDTSDDESTKKRKRTHDEEDEEEEEEEEDYEDDDDSNKWK